MTDEQQTEGNDLTELQQALDQAIAKSEENLAGWKRSQADFENFRKRSESESRELVAFGKHAAFVQIVPILDSLEQAMLHAPDLADEKYSKWRSGLEGILKQMETTMKQIGIEKIEAVGKKFDPNLHEAVREVPGSEEGIVAEQYQTGYTLDGRTLRPAQVAIFKQAINE